MTSRVWPLVVLGAVLLSASVVHAWTPIDGSQPTWPGTVPYSLHEAGSADLGGFAATEAVVREGMDDWTLRACTDLTTTYRGATSSVAFQSGTAVIGWYESGWPESPSAIGVTGPSFDGSGRILDAHMAMNGVNFTWATGAGSGGTVNTYSIVLHEGGHYYGLGHSADRNATMYYAYSGGISTLNPDDETGICTLYPGTGGGTTDCTTTGCPAGQSCVSGRCVDDTPPGGTGTTCDACTADSQCAGRCLRYPDGGGYCGSPCAGDGDCGGDGCEAVSDGTRLCVRRNTAGEGDCSGGPAPDPEPVPDPDPDPGPACGGAGDCAPGERCDATSGSCVPVPTGALGDPCASNDACDSNICVVDTAFGDNFCTRLCDETDACPTGFGCEEGLCRPGRAGLGDLCGENADCMSDICADGPDGPFCTRVCTEDDCPGGYGCVPTSDGGARVCAPTEAAPTASGRAETRILHGSCSAAPVGGGFSPFWALLLFAVVATGRRRR